MLCVTACFCLNQNQHFQSYIGNVENSPNTYYNYFVAFTANHSAHNAHQSVLHYHRPYIASRHYIQSYMKMSVSQHSCHQYDVFSRCHDNLVTPHFPIGNALPKRTVHKIRPIRWRLPNAWPVHIKGTNCAKQYRKKAPEFVTKCVRCCCAEHARTRSLTSFLRVCFSFI